MRSVPPRAPTFVVGASVFLITGAVNLQLPEYGTLARSAGFGSGGMALLLAGYGACLLFTLTTLGGVADRLGARAVVLAGLACAALATALTAIAPDVVGLGVARWLQGLGVGLGMGAATAWASHLDGPARAARLTGFTSSAGFGAGALLTSAWTAAGGFAPSAWWIWLGAIALAIPAVVAMPAPIPPDPLGRLLRLPAFPPGSGLAGASIALGWGVAGIIVAVVPGVLTGLGIDGGAGLALASMLTGGVLAQPFARGLEARRSLAMGAGTLVLGTLGVAAGIASESLGLLLAGAFVAGTSTHGLGYVGGLGVITALEGSTARNTSGYFLFAYVGFTLPAVFVGTLVDAAGPSGAFGLLAVVVLFGAAWLAFAALRSLREAP